MKSIKLFSIVIMALILLYNESVLAQAEKVKGAVKLGLSFTQVNEEAPVLKASAKIKSGKRFEPLGGVEINLSFMEITPNSLLGKIVTDEKGNGSLVLPQEVVMELDSLSPFKFIATVSSSDQFNETQTEIEITRSRIELSLVEEDSTRSMEAKIWALQKGKWTFVPETEVKLFIKRLYNDLPVGDDTYTTNEVGIVSTEFVITIPGDTSGNIMAGAKMDDNETYGTVSAVKAIAWGIPQKKDDSFSERSLWASRVKTPLWLLIFPNIIITTVWGFIFYLFYLVLKIRKIGIDHRKFIN